MGGDDQKRRETKRFTREELAELAERARGDRQPPATATATAPSEEPVVAVQAEITPMSRSLTLHDPLTTQLLAEVARRVQTMELDVPDPETVVDEDPDAEAVHPNLRRRR